MLIQLLAGLALLAVLWMLFRFAMALRWAKVAREQARSEAESRGRRVVTEIPLSGDELAFFQEEGERFHWGGRSVAKAEIKGARLLLNGNVVGAFSRPGAALPEPPPAEEYEGGERWDVLLYLTSRLTMNVPARMDFVNITPQVEKAVADSGVREGLCLVNAMHITASVFINDDEPGLHEDYKRWLEQLAPYDPSPERYRHNRTGEDNGDAHHKRQVMGREVVVAVTKGKLDVGPWEQIFYGEFDGRRPKRVLVKVIGE
jgi:secondary thiamine-phosphate synthase enzyme